MVDNVGIVYTAAIAISRKRLRLIAQLKSHGRVVTYGPVF